MSYTNMKKHDLAGKRIIVSGAGLAGMAFARALERSWPQEHPKPELVIYERSSKVLPADPLDDLGLLDLALSNSTVGAGGTQQLPTLWDKNWQQMLDPNTPTKSNERIPSYGVRLARHTLRQMLLDAMPSNTNVQWEKGCDSVEVIDGGRVHITLSDGSTDECDLLVAADGANSKVRSSLLPGRTLDYVGAIIVQGTSRFPKGKPHPVNKKWGITMGGGVAFLNFPFDSDTGVWGLTYTSDQPRERIRGKEAIDRQQEIFDEIRQRGKMFQEPFNQFIEATDPASLQIFSGEHKSPMSHAQNLSHANVVMIGDSNHPMTPFSGMGANLALLDAVVLAKELSENASLRTAIENFDADSAPRSQKAISRAYLTIALLHAEGIKFWLLRMFLAVLNFVFRIRNLIRS
ncbi:hypothetical protein E2P81_ATG10607 [Venturia nashicola]|nr:hypothetical protein E2P81_ATG10607 [Venturia nashicola]